MVDRLTAAVKALNSHAAQRVKAIPSLQASVRDLSQRVTASTTARPPQPAAHPPLSTRPPAVGQGQPPRSHLATADKPGSPTPGHFDTACPSYDTTTHKCHGNPAAYTAKHRKSYEAQMWRDGKYPDITEFHSPAPAAPGQPGPSSIQPTPMSLPLTPEGPGRRTKGKVLLWQP